MSQLFLGDIYAPNLISMVSMEEFIPVGDAVIDETHKVFVKSAGGIKTHRFKANEEVLINMRFYSEKPLTLKIGCITSDGNVNFDIVSPVVTQTFFDKELGQMERIAKYFDAADLSVYCDAVEFFVQIECSEANTFQLSSGSIRTQSELERLSIYADNLEDIVKNIESKLVKLQYRVESNYENIAVSPNGKKFLINVDDHGNIGSTPVIPDKVLFIGNSLLLGMDFYGMCATSPQKDYFHYVSEAIKAKNPDAVITRARGSKFEHLEDASKFDDLWNGKDDFYDDKPFAENVTSDLDLIIVQLSENVNNELRYQTQQETMDRFISNLKKSAPKARIVWIRNWWPNPRRDEIIETACRKWRIGCFSMADLHTKDTVAHFGQQYELEDGSHKIVSDRWITHPGDAGMKAIADRLIDYLKL